MDIIPSLKTRFLPGISRLFSVIGKPLTYLLILSLELIIKSTPVVLEYARYKAWRFRLFYKRLSVAWRRRFEHRFARQALGGLILPLAFLMIAISPDLINAENSSLDMNSLSLSQEASLLIRTTESVRLPLSPLVLSQGYIPGHLALDIRAPLGTPIYPIMKGKVVEATNSRSGYGNYVVIDHGSGLESLYAHMSKVRTEAGEIVTTESVIGEVGSTGRSTGNHLHLEIIDQGRKINPLTIIGGLK